MSLINLTVKIEGGEVVPKSMYDKLEHRFTRLDAVHYKVRCDLDTVENRMTSLMREIATHGDIPVGFMDYLQDKYSLIQKRGSDNG